MRKTNRNETENRLTVNTETLAEMLDCGKATAVKIGDAAKARIRLGKRVLWNMRKVQEYLDAAGMVESEVK